MKKFSLQDLTDQAAVEDARAILRGVGRHLLRLFHSVGGWGTHVLACDGLDAFRAVSYAIDGYAYQKSAEELKKEIPVTSAEAMFEQEMLNMYRYARGDYGLAVDEPAATEFRLGLMSIVFGSVAGELRRVMDAPWQVFQELFPRVALAVRAVEARSGLALARDWLPIRSIPVSDVAVLAGVDEEEVVAEIKNGNLRGTLNGTEPMVEVADAIRWLEARVGEPVASDADDKDDGGLSCGIRWLPMPASLVAEQIEGQSARVRE